MITVTMKNSSGAVLDTEDVETGIGAAESAKRMIDDASELMPGDTIIVTGDSE